MDKGRRQELTKLKHIKRCKAIGVNPKDHYCYKEQGKPCSCYACNNIKYKRSIKHKSKIV